MEANNFEENIIKDVVNYYFFISNYNNKKKDKNFYSLFTYNYLLVQYDSENKIVTNPDLFLSLMSLSLFGVINCEKEIFEFNIADKENDDVKRIFYIVISLLISEEYIEFKNLYKAIKNEERNSFYIVETIKKVLEKNEENISLKINEFLFLFIFKRVPRFLEIIYENDKIVK